MASGILLMLASLALIGWAFLGGYAGKLASVIVGPS